VPKSKVRKKSEYTPPSRVLAGSSAKQAAPSASWYPIAMVVVLVIGLAWISVYYIAGDRVPVMDTIGAGNFLVGFGFMIAGLIMAVRWR
jgi:uncharacterized BrkB/YihY/UPF0761 family membrane protein